METKQFCKDKKMAISILEALALNTNSIAQRAALESVVQYIERVAYDIPDDPDERQRLIEQLEKDLSLYDSPAQREAMLGLYCGMQDFNVVVLPPGSDCMLRREGGDDDK
jgi:ABC-type hemin transport system substrate-binding protein